MPAFFCARRLFTTATRANPGQQAYDRSRPGSAALTFPNDEQSPVRLSQGLKHLGERELGIEVVGLLSDDGLVALLGCVPVAELLVALGDLGPDGGAVGLREAQGVKYQLQSD